MDRRRYRQGTGSRVAPVCPTEHVDTEHVDTDHVDSDHVHTDHVDIDHVDSDHVDSDHVDIDHVDSDHVDSDQIYTDGIAIDFRTSIPASPARRAFRGCPAPRAGAAGGTARTRVGPTARGQPRHAAASEHACGTRRGAVRAGTDTRSHSGAAARQVDRRASRETEVTRSIMREGFALAIVVSLTAGRAHAQSSKAAEQLFQHGRELAKQQRWEEACTALETSQRLEPALGTQLNLARCYEHVGKIVSAWELYQVSSTMANSADDPERRDYALAQAAALWLRLPTLAIIVPDHHAGLIVTQDGVRIDIDVTNGILHANPGAHTIVASAPGFEAVTLHAWLVEGRTEMVAIPDLAPTSTPASSEASAIAVLPAERASRWNTRTYVAAAGGAGGLATTAAGLWFLASARGKLNAAKALCGAQLVCAPEHYEQGTLLTRDARSRATISTVLTTAGGVLLVASAALYLTAPAAPPPERATAQLVPLVGDHSAGLAIAGDALAVGAPHEDSAAFGVDQDQTSNAAPQSGAAYVFTRDGANWLPRAYVKASNTERIDLFGSSIALSADTLAAGAHWEGSGATGINGDQGNSVYRAGAAYLFR